MNKSALAGSLAFLIAAFYLFIIAIRPGDTVELIPGHVIPDRLAVLLGAIGVLGAVVVGAEALRGRKESATRDVRRAS